MSAYAKNDSGARHRTILFRCSIVVRLCAFCLSHLASTWLPLFDASPLLVQGVTKLELPLLRWDTFHFYHIAAQGYVFEHEWAFLPGVPYLMRFLSMLIQWNGHGLTNMLSMGMVAAIACDSSQVLYSLSLYHLRSADLAFLASILSLVPTSPATASFVPYMEPFFTHFSYRGMLCCTRREWIKASLWFALSGGTRSNGILLSGFILWGLLVKPFIAGNMPTVRILLKSIALTTVVVAPFVAYQSYAYSVFCTQNGQIPEWCSRFPPSIYTHVQSKYWDIGFLRYWTLNQLPNFLIASPSLLLIFSFAFHHLANASFLSLNSNEKAKPLEAAFQNASITPHAIHAAIFACILLFTSHTQIVLRLAASMPLVYWAAAWLLIHHPTYGKIWVIWSVLWGGISIILWAAFLPPA